MASAFVNGSQFEVSKFRLLGFGFGIVLVNDDNDGAVRSDLDGLSPLLLGCAGGAGDVGKGEPGCRLAHRRFRGFVCGANAASTSRSGCK